MLRLPRFLKECHVCASLPVRFVETAPSPRHKMVRSKRREKKKNAAPATTLRKATSQSAAPTTKKRCACIDALRKYFTCHAKHENNLPFCDFGTPKRAFRARLLSNLKCRGNLPKHLRKLSPMAANWRRHDDDTSKTTRTQIQPQTPTINGNPSLRIREKTQSTQKICFAAFHIFNAFGVKRGRVVGIWMTPCSIRVASFFLMMSGSAHDFIQPEDVSVENICVSPYFTELACHFMPT